MGKRSKDNDLARWTRERWTTVDGRPSRGRWRYLPADAWAHLTDDEIRRTNRAKRRGHSRGKQWVKQPSDVARKTARFRRKSGRS